MKKIPTAAGMPIGQMHSFVVDGFRVAIFRRSAEEFICFEDTCTHDGAQISDGKIEGNAVVCARHGAKFNLKNGQALSMPATSPIEVFGCQIQDGELYVDLDI